MPDNIEFPPDMPEEMRQYIATILDRQEMSVNVHRHELLRFFEELSEEQSRQLSMLFALLEQHPDRLPYFDGYLHAVQAHRFARCAACGANHEAELSEIGDK